MKSFVALSVLVFTLSACTFHPAPLALNPIGPAPLEERPASLDQGRLIVYSAWDPFANRYLVNHTPYTIISEDGKWVKQVTNHLGPLDDDPARVLLPAGSYTVKARSQDYGNIEAPVVIKTGRTTVLYLDGSNHPHPSAADKSKFVRLPDGELVGWAANASEK
ncbi:MAG: hypothetical protein JWR26_2678 [Pedosphaera sp.]|nr:hypothetical protein [Pedosphaera sp.]